MFCHLHVHDEYSLLDGFGLTSNYVKEVKKKEQKYIAITNHGNIDGLIKLQSECGKQGVKPIFGCEAYVTEDATIRDKNAKYKHMLLLIKNKKGWRNLCKLMSYANSVGFYHRPRIDIPILLDHCEGLIIGTACAGSFITEPWGRKLFVRLLKEVGEDLFIEIMPHNEDIQKQVNGIALDLHKRFGAKLVATNDCHYIKAHQWEAQEVLLAINTGAKMANPNRFKFDFRGLFLRSEDQMRRAFSIQDQFDEAVYGEAMENTIEIAEKCSSFKIERAKVELPKMDLKGESADEILTRKCLRGLEKLKLEKRAFPIYKRRLREELNLIRSKRFSPYFLLVKKHIIDFADKKGIGRGPGRGSVGCSLVARVLNITLIDPVEYNLPFGRFISEDRIDFPDIDTDFEYDRVGEIRGSLEKHFGERNVFGITTFTTMKGKAVIRDVSRVYDVPDYAVEEMAAAVDQRMSERGDHEAVKDTVKKTEVGKRFAEKYPKVVEMAIELEGQKRAASQHPAAVVVATKKLRRNVVIVRRNNNLVANWDMDDLEYVGLIKFDILSLKTISSIIEAVKLIEEKHKVKVNLKKIRLDDQKVFDEMNKGNFAGVFQLSGYTTASIAQRIKIENFLHVSDAIALSRPGPKDSGMTDEYIRRRHGGEWEGMHPIYEETLADTYGVVVYQEQVMAVISEVGGLSYSTADRIRKVIGKKRNKKEFEPFRVAFIDGCRRNKTLSRGEAKEFWNGLLKHSRYSFNKAHAVEYAMVAYWCQWLKTYYPTEFLCALLTHAHKEKKQEIIDEAIRLNLEPISPKVGKSDNVRWIADGSKLYAPFIELDGIGPVTAKKLEFGVAVEKGFFGDEVAEIGGKAGKILAKAGCYDPDNKTSAKDFLPFDIIGLKRAIIRERTFKKKKAQLKCGACALRQECSLPVQPSPGIYNVPLVGEAPGYNEDLKGEGFIGKAGDILWNFLANFGLKKEMFHITNMCKCYPRNSKTPTFDQIKTCKELWLDEEFKILKPKLVLAFGNTGLKGFLGQETGIKRMSGKVKRIDGMNVVFCLHPAAVFRNQEENKPIFEAGMLRFVEELKRADGFNEIIM